MWKAVSFKKGGGGEKSDIADVPVALATDLFIRVWNDMS